ncbi:unnamed protein product [Lymnaea stagnalis]|uniref:Serine/threonine-protein phosphatase 4 regulatory subunit 3-like central domain-containing protein n=1 Tax=Lymnaea stagnalis TaxID=6523 RepID=A0AAV2HV52_LYMST
MIELFEFIKVEDIKSLSVYIVETFQKDLEGIKYVKTFETLKVRYEQQRDRNREKHSFDSPLKKVTPIKLKKSGKRKWSDFQVLPEIEDDDDEDSDRHAASIVRNNRFRRDARAPDEDEEMWFSQDDENEENDNAPQVSELLKNKIESDLDHIHKLWENKKTKENQSDVGDSPPRLLSGSKSAINISIKTGSNSSLSSLLSMPDSPGSPGGSPPAPGSPESPSSPPTSPHSPNRLCPTPHVSPNNVQASKGSSGTINSTVATSITTSSASITTSRVSDSPPSTIAVTTKTPGLKGLVDYPDEDSEEEEEEEEEDVIAPSPKRPRVGT